MKRLTTTILLTLLLSLTGMAQELPKPLRVPDQPKIEVKYRLEMKKHVMGHESMTDTMIVLSGDKEALCYTTSTFLHDSLQCTDDGRRVVMDSFKEGLLKNDESLIIEPRTLPEYFYTNRERGELSVYESDRLYIPILHREEVETPEWRIRDNDCRIIGGYKTYKAVCDFRGRRFEAWYTEEVPDRLGPWKLHGLPGLIIEVYDEDKEYFWTVIDVRRDPTPLHFGLLEDPLLEVDRKTYLRDTRAFLEGGDPEENGTLQEIIRRGLRRSYRQKREKRLSYDFLERDYVREGDTTTTETNTEAVLPASALTIPGKPSRDHLLVKYRYEAVKDTTNGSTFTPDDQLLEIRPDQSIYYSLKTYRMQALYSSKEGKKKWQGLFRQEIDKLNAGGKMSDFMARLPRTGAVDFIIKESDPGTMRVYDKVGGEQYFYDDQAEMKWSLTDSTRVILGYECQQAVCDFRGRRWIAWFTYDVPIDNGPWKLHGLPGLICEAYDAQRHYHYTITGLEQKETTLDYTILIDPKARVIERKKLYGSQKLYIDSGGELAVISNTPSSNNYPEPKEIE